MHIPFFRIWYSTTFTILSLIFLVLAAISPTDLIIQSLKSNDLAKAAVVAGCCLLTIIILGFIGASRIYTNRTVLAAIPKSYLPIEPGEVGKHVRRMIKRQFDRSAIIAWDSRPRALQDEPESSAPHNHSTHANSQQHRRPSPTLARPDSDTIEIPISPAHPPWGKVAHPGWSSPTTHDYPNLQFSNVVAEIPNLIEAKAVYLAPPDPVLSNLGGASEGGASAAPVPDARVVALLQRPATMGLGEYLSNLSNLGLIDPPEKGARFVRLYEHARFSTRPLTEAQFRLLMEAFAEILAGMTSLSSDVLDDLLSSASGFEADDDDRDADMRRSQTSLSVSSGGSAVHYHTPRVDRSFGPASFAVHGSGPPVLGGVGAVSAGNDWFTPTTQDFANPPGPETASNTSSDSVIRYVT